MKMWSGLFPRNVKNHGLQHNAVNSGKGRIKVLA
uniref:Uncharacterized protein n=1 Tax=viral metagenome TaxID=1070528 RepID=A0A6C0AUJ1_9ZZZZ